MADLFIYESIRKKLHQIPMKCENWLRPLPTILLAIVLLFLSSNCFAGELAEDAMGNYFRMLWGLLVVLGVILLLYGLLRKRFSLLGSGPDKDIRILEVKPLMGKKALCLVEVKGQEFLLGISDNNINRLATLEPKDKSSFAKTLKSVETVQNS